VVNDQDGTPDVLKEWVWWRISKKYIDNNILKCYYMNIQSEMLWVTKHYLLNDALWALTANCLAESTIWRPKKRQQFVKDAFFQGDVSKQSHFCLVKFIIRLAPNNWLMAGKEIF
jgi:hypothetical protein